MSKNEIAEFDENIIRDRIYSIRGFQVMLDRDLAELYGVKPFRLREQVKRNIERFPPKFCFSLNSKEIQNLRSQIATSSWGGNRNKPYVFTHAHDRFIIIDSKDVYHLGASLKDLGKKWFAFSKIEKSDMELLRKLEKY